MAKSALCFRVRACVLLLCCGFVQTSALGQSLPSVNVVQCEIPQLNFWSPPTTSNGRTTVGVEFFVVDIIEIEDRRGRFTLDFTVTLTWHDSRLESVAGNAQGCSARLSEVWHPQMVFVNVAEAENADDGRVEILPGGSVLYAKRITRQFTVPLDLREFPFDQQDLVVEIASLIYGPDEIEFVTMEPGLGMLEGASYPGWRMGKLTSFKPDQPIVAASTRHSNLRFSIKIERLSGYYVWRLFFPLFMITLMAWSVFWLEPAYLAGQISVATGAVFSLMAFLVSQGEILPTVSYLSVADRLIVACVLLVFIAFGESIVTGSLAQQNRLQLARMIDKVGRWAYPALMLILLATIRL